MEYEIRRLAPADTEAYVALRCEMLADSPFAFLAAPEDDFASDPEFVARQLEKSGESIIVGAFAPDLVGSVGIARDRHVKALHKADVWGVYVTPAFRRRGIGRRLLEAGIRHARTLPGVVQLVLGVSERTPDARALYERVGFRAWGTEPRALRIHGEFADETYMGLALDGQ